MIIPMLLFLMPLQGQPQQQIQQQLDQVHRQLELQQTQMERMLAVLERQGPPDRRGQQQLQPLRPVCSVEVRRVSGPDQRKVPLNAASAIPLNLFSTVSRPVDGCLPAEVQVTASYLDAADNLVCSGAVENIAIQTSLTQSINLEIRPWNFREFVRWKNEPPQTNSGPKRLICVNPEGTAETTAEDIARVTSARVRATVLPVGGGMSTTELQLMLR
jgi:hypothetical protein